MDKIYKVPFIFLATVAFGSCFIVPEPTGPFVTGAQDMEFVDNTYPSPFSEDDSGRRIMFRIYYPVCNRTDYIAENNTCAGTELGRRRRYFEQGEWEAYFGSVINDTELVMFAESLETFSYLNAPMVTELGPRPILIYAHGATAWVSDNTALMEELASHGFAAFALGLPGFASTVVYPNGDVASVHNDFIAALSHPDSSLLPLSEQIQTRYDKIVSMMTSQDGVAAFLPRYRDDMLAMVDHLLDPLLNNTLLKQLVGEDDLQGLIYMGFSFGGAAAGSAAHQDERANGAVNMDGLHYSTDLLGQNISVPFLTFAQNYVRDFPTFFYFNEFFYEDLVTMGSRDDVTRVRLPTNTSHTDITDLKFLPLNVRESVGFVNTIDAEHLHAVLMDFLLGFVQKHAAQNSSWTSTESFEKFSDIELVNVSYVAEWAQSRPTSPASPIASLAMPLFMCSATVFALMAF